MQNQQLTEDSMIRELRNVETPAPPGDLMERLAAESQRHRTRLWLWAAPVATAACLTLVFMFVLGLKPSYSLADVYSSFEKQERYTITNTRLLGGGSSFKVVIYRDGPLWKKDDGPVGRTIGLTDRTITITPPLKFVDIDSRRETVPVEFKVDELLRKGAKPIVERGVMVGGRQVDRFTVSETYRDQGRTHTLSQTLLVDPKSKLPIQDKEMHDGNSWGDIWDYDYSTPEPSVFSATVPPGFTVYELPKQRKELSTRLAQQAVGGLVVDERHIVIALLSEKPPKNHWLATLQVDSLESSVQCMILNLPWLARGGPHSGDFVGNMGAMNTLAKLRIGGRDWYFVEHSFGMPDDWHKVDSLLAAKTASGSIDVSGRDVAFKDVPVLRTGSAAEFLRSFEGG